MDRDFARYEARLYSNGLAEPDTAIFGRAGQAVKWSRDDPARKALEPLLGHRQAGAILHARPAQPYASLLDYLAGHAAGGVIHPYDSESRVFLQDLPVAAGLETGTLLPALENRKCVIVPGHGIVARGAGAAEAYVNFSAACFSLFVKFFFDALCAARTGKVTDSLAAAFSRACKHLSPPAVFGGGLMEGPFAAASQVRGAICEAGREVVKRGLVDACFGNISYRLGNTLYISASGSFLDELDNAVVEIFLEDGPERGKKPSSELPAHREIALSTNFRAVLHGHPLFSVILSMDCREADCPQPGDCYRRCPRPRQVGGIPIVSGETGGGPWGLSRTVPAAVSQYKAAIVYGHGVFACASKDFNSALGRMVTIERVCRKIYFEQAGTRIGAHRWNLQA